jgi:hypothetical protein
MFLRVPLIDEDGYESPETVNIMNIVKLGYVNKKNVAAGTKFYLIDGTTPYTLLTMDVIQLRIDKIIDNSVVQILVSYMAKKLPKPTKKKSTAKTVKY